jgi:adenine phosphoribosyltransferase
MRAACNLVKKFNPQKIMVNFLIEITDEGLHGRDVFNDVEVTTLMTV